MERNIRQSTIKKYLIALKEIHFKLSSLSENTMPLSTFCREKGLSKSAATEIVKGGLIKNKGTRGKGVWYEWNSILPNEKMAKELILRTNKIGADGMRKTRLKLSENIEKPSFDIVSAQKECKEKYTDRSLTESILAAFPEYSVFELKKAIDKLID